ncbi:MAG: DUF3931 domain-containing protein [Bacillaceae bacterium]|nr:DUF3931 domain-containing protein [Bacillaceae bacterium]
MSSDKKVGPKLVSLEGKKEEKARNLGELIIDGESYSLSKFVVCGEDQSGKRVMFTWNTNLDELIIYTKILQLVADDKLRAGLEE